VRAHPSDKEIQEKKHDAEEEQDKSRVYFAASEPADVANELGPDGSEAGILPNAVKGTDDGVTGEIPAEDAEFVVDADEVVFTLAPD
jgi:hypothetical protein